MKGQIGWFDYLAFVLAANGTVWAILGDYRVVACIMGATGWIVAGFLLFALVRIATIQTPPGGAR